MTKIGELFAGYGGLGQGVQSVIGGDIAWFSEFDDAPSKILAHHFPGIPNHGDITKIDWSTVEPVDVLTGGFPCQDVSLAGARRGLKEGTRSGLWSYFAEAIDALKPELVVIENVRGLLSAEATGPVEPDPWNLGNGTDGPTLRAIGAVLGNLSELGYDARWTGLRAADAGAPHGRFRVFIVAYPDGSRSRRGPAESGASQRDNAAIGSNTGKAAENPDLSARYQRRIATPRQTETGRTRADTGRRGRAPTTDADNTGRGEPAQHASSHAATDTGRVCSERRGGDSDMVSPPRTSEVDGEQRERDGDAVDNRGATNWGDYRPAIERWETVLGRPAPAPTNGDGRNGQHRLAAEFVEWMLGLEPGWVTDPAIGLTRNQQLKALGNGVVPQQAALAIGYLLRDRVAA